MSLAETATCPVCASKTGTPFVSIPMQPVHCNVLWDTAEGALSAPRGDLDLVFCGQCGHVHNASFDEALTTYGGTYENSLHHSAVFQEYATRLVDELIERHELRNKDIVEVGAGQGDFLAMLCAAGDNRGTGFDPSHVESTNPVTGPRMVSEFYGERFADYPADLIVCRHVLEHIGQSGEFVNMIRRVVADRPTSIFFEVPNALWTLLDGGVWDLIYEHCGYFTPTSLVDVFRRAGFHVDHVEPVFGNQFLTIEASPTLEVPAADEELSSEVAHTAAAVDSFAETYRSQVSKWSAVMASLAGDGKRAVIWGAGSKGVTFLNALDTAGVVDRAVDINPRKHGMFVAGSGQVIVGPDALVEETPDAVFVMNPNYRSEIANTLQTLGIVADIHVV